MTEDTQVVRRSVSRRHFLMGAATAGGVAITQSASARVKRRAQDERLAVAVVGAGGRGAENLQDLKGTGADIIALCDCDARQAADSFRKYPQAHRYSDWRKMLESEVGIDAVLVATPDHNHAIISCAAIKLGRHVYCEKPLTHSIWEARQMAKLAADNHVVTQMGTQGHAFVGTRRAVEVVRSGAIGEVSELHVWTDRPAGWWPQGVTRPADTPPVPEGLDWDVWLGPAAERPYNPAYVPFKWRGFWDFGTGAIGDMGIHNLDTAFWALELGPPISAEVIDRSPAFDDPSVRETAPLWSILEIRFPARGGKPPVKMTWYDGGKLPPRDVLQGEQTAGKDGGSLAIGTKGTLFTRTWHGGEGPDDMFLLLPRKQFAGYEPPAPTLTRPKSHHQEWVDACRGQGQALSNFGYASVLTESLILGNVALRTGKKIEWDSKAMRARNCPDAAQYVHPTFRKGWTL